MGGQDHWRLTNSEEIRKIDHMAQSNKVIITCAVTGAIHTPSMSPHLPVTADQIAEFAIGAAEAGAAIVHLHARDEQTGRPDQTPEAFARFLQRIKQSTNAVINLTTGGAPFMTVQERVKPAETFKPEVASLNMGSMNFGLFPMLNRFKTFEHDWEAQALENSRDLVFRNTYKDIEFVLRTLAGSGTRFEFECYDTSHLYNLSHFLERGLVKPPLFVQTVFGILGGIGPHPEDVMHMKRTADRLFGAQYKWSVLGAGRSQLPSLRWPPRWAATSRRAEDSLWSGPGKLARASAEQVRAARQIIEGLGLSVASPDEAREISTQGWRPVDELGDSTPRFIGGRLKATTELSRDPRRAIVANGRDQHQAVTSALSARTTRWWNVIDAPRTAAALVSTSRRSSIIAGARYSICSERTANATPELSARSDRESAATQPLGAAALKEAQIGSVINPTRKVGVF